jgi:hypothetical protein
MGSICLLSVGGSTYLLTGGLPSVPRSFVRYPPRHRGVVNPNVTDIVNNSHPPQHPAPMAPMITVAMVEEDHRRAALFATAQQHAREILIDEDNRQAALRATTNQREMEAAAASRGMYVDEYLRSINQFPTMERVELDHFLAAWKATTNERALEAKAAAMGMWPDQYLVYTKAL